MRSSLFPCEAPAAVRASGARRTPTLGFVEIHRKGSHLKMEHPDGRRIVFPYHEEVDRYTLKGALRDATVSVEDFVKNVK